MRICQNPLVRSCSEDIQGPEICNTHYETSCETTYKTYEVEQDEPVCVMELMKKCDDVTSKYLKCICAVSVWLWSFMFTLSLRPFKKKGH